MNLNLEADMATALEMDAPTESAGTDITVIVAANPGIVLLDRRKYSVWYEGLRARGAALPADVSSKKNRDALRTFAADVRTEKAGIKKARLRLTEEWRSMTAQANAAGKEIDEQLEQLAVEIRQPLTDWEIADTARIAECKLVIENLRAAAVVTPEDTSASVIERGKRVHQTGIDPERFGDLTEHAANAKDVAVKALLAARDRLKQEEADREKARVQAEADRAELARLRAENEARVAREREEQEAREAEQRAADEARQAEERRVAAERAEADRVARAEREAADRARREVEEAAARERADAEARHATELASERRRAQEAETARQTAVDAAERQERARKDAAAKAAAEQAAREADRVLQRKLKTEAKLALIACGISEDAAQKIVLAVRAKEIPYIVWAA